MGEATAAERTRQFCHHSFWKFIRMLLDDNPASQVHPAKQRKFCLSVVVPDTMQQDPGLPRRSLAAAAKSRVSEEASHHYLMSLQTLPRQGNLVRSTTPGAAIVWAEAVASLPDEALKFALNAALDTLPHNINLYLWKKSSDHCHLCCGKAQSLLHTLNVCKAALDLRRHTSRHDAVLDVLS